MTNGRNVCENAFQIRSKDDCLYMIVYIYYSLNLVEKMLEFISSLVVSKICNENCIKTRI